MAKKLYIGDPCFALQEEIYYGVWGDELSFEDGEIKSNGTLYGYVHGTAEGDGCFNGEMNNFNYCVDSGTLSVLDLTTFTPYDYYDEFGLVVECDDDCEYSLKYNEGKFTFTWTINGEYKQEQICTNFDV